MEFRTLRHIYKQITYHIVFQILEKIWIKGQGMEIPYLQKIVSMLQIDISNYFSSQS